MRTIKVLDRQNIIDVAIQYYGTAAAVIDLCQDIGLELDSELTPGQFLLVQNTYPASANGPVADYLAGNSVVVVSMDDDEDGDVLGDNTGDIIITNNGNYIGA